MLYSVLEKGSLMAYVCVLITASRPSQQVCSLSKKLFEAVALSGEGQAGF